MHSSLFKEFLIGVFVCTIMLAPVFMLTHYMDKTACSSKAEAMETSYKYGFFEGCMYEIDGKYVPKENFVVNEPREN